MKKMILLCIGLFMVFSIILVVTAQKQTNPTTLQTDTSKRVVNGSDLIIKNKKITFSFERLDFVETTKRTYIKDNTHMMLPTREFAFQKRTILDKDINFSLITTSESGYRLITSGRHTGRFRVIGTDQIYIPFVRFLFWNETGGLVNTWIPHLDVEQENANTLRLDISGHIAVNKPFTRIVIEDPLVNEQTPIIAYVTADGNSATEKQELIDLYQNNSIKNFSMMLNINGQTASNLTAYESIIDAYYLGGRAVGSSQVIWVINQTYKGIMFGGEGVRWADEMGLCNNTNPNFAGTNIFIQNNTMPIFNQSNGVGTGNQAWYLSFKDYIGCTNQTVFKNTSWAGRLLGDSGYMARPILNGTVYQKKGVGTITTRSRWVLFPPQDSLINSDWANVTKNLSIKSMLWILDPFLTSANATSFASESEGDTSIGLGVQNALLSSYTNYTTQIISARALNGNQFSGTFDWMAKKGTKVWAFNYVTSGESNVAGTFNMTPNVYVLQITNLTQAQITLQVETLINATK